MAPRTRSADLDRSISQKDRRKLQNRLAQKRYRTKKRMEQSDDVGSPIPIGSSENNQEDLTKSFDQHCETVNPIDLNWPICNEDLKFETSSLFDVEPDYQLTTAAQPMREISSWPLDQQLMHTSFEAQQSSITRMDPLSITNEIIQKALDAQKAWQQTLVEELKLRNEGTRLRNEGTRLRMEEQKMSILHFPRTPEYWGGST